MQCSLRPHLYLVGHYSRAEVTAWCEKNGIVFIFGLPGNTPLDRLVDEAADDVRTRRALKHKPALCDFAETHYQPNPGTRSAGSVSASKSPQRGSITASSSPASTPVRPSTSMRPSPAPAAALRQVLRPRWRQLCPALALTRFQIVEQRADSVDVGVLVV
jgi:hypothetical protein